MKVTGGGGGDYQSDRTMTNGWIYFKIPWHVHMQIGAAKSSLSSQLN